MSTNGDLEQKVMQELEMHVQRILEHWNRNRPYEQVLNVTERRNDFVTALERLIDQRIHEYVSRSQQQ